MTRAIFLPAVLALGIVSVLALAGRTGQADPANAKSTEIVQALMHKDLPEVPGKEIRMLTVEYPPGAASPAHQHHAQVFVYVLSGHMRMQVAGSAVVTLGPGETFYEAPNDVHSVSANDSRTEPAKILVFMLKDKDPGKAGT
jgi:quercetin dioxygenase-like cupin family protein